MTDTLDASEAQPISEPTDGAREGDPSDAVEEPDDGRAWYIVQTYSGYESKVKTNLDQRVRSMDVEDRIFDVVIPTEDEIEIRDGQRRTVSKKLFPGYVLVRLVMDDDTWSVVRHTPGVTGFAGSNVEDRARPTPLSDAEVNGILRTMQTAQPRVNVGFKIGDSVRVTDGVFNEFIGQVDQIDLDKGKVRVMVTMFGRETPVELDFLQVEKQ